MKPRNAYPEMATLSKAGRRLQATPSTETAEEAFDALRDAWLTMFARACRHGQSPTSQRQGFGVGLGLCAEGLASLPTDDPAAVELRAELDRFQRLFLMLDEFGPDPVREANRAFLDAM